MNHETMILSIKCVNNIPKGIFTIRDDKTYTGHIWWDDEIKIEVPTRLWLDEKINLNNIQSYVNQYNKKTNNGKSN